MARIIDYSTKIKPTSGDYFLIDNESGGSKKVPADDIVMKSEVDPTLTQPGQAADAKKTGDKIDDLKEDLTNEWNGAIPFIGGLISGEIVHGDTGTIESVQSLMARTDYIEVDHLYNVICKSASGTEYNNCFFDENKQFISQLVITTTQTATKIPTGAKYVMFSGVKTNIENGTYLFTTADHQDINLLKVGEDAIFNTPIPSYAKGILEINFNKTTVFDVSKYSEYKMTGFYYKTGVFYLFIRIAGYNGSTWENVDSIDIRTAQTPTEKPLMQFTSTYGAFTVTVAPSLFTVYGNNNIDCPIKNDHLNVGAYELRNSVDEINLYLNFPSFSYKDIVYHWIVVDANGNGDYTTIASAYASITDSRFTNQYIVAIMPGTYNEHDLIPPLFTHTTGMNPDTVIVSGIGKHDSTKSVFDLKHTCKLSNVTILAEGCISNPQANQNRYGIHFDDGDSQRFVLVENVKVVKVYDIDEDHPNGIRVLNRAYNGAWGKNLVGMGLQGRTNKITFKNCTFVDGLFISHTQPNDEEPTCAKCEVLGCKFINSYLQLNSPAASYNTNGEYVCAVDGCFFEYANNKPNVILHYTQGHHAWTLCGSNNTNLTIGFDNADSDTAEAWECVNTSDVNEIHLANGVSVTKGKWVDSTGAIANNTNPSLLFGCTIEDKTSNAVDGVRVWVGKAYPINIADGEYGIESGDLSAIASPKIGIVKNNVLYRY